jgi:hypothetical protein
MPIRFDAERWCRLLLVVSLILLLPAAAGFDGDDGWTAAGGPGEGDDDRLRLAAGALPAPAWVPSPPPYVPLTGRPGARDAAVSRWIGLSPTDRAPPRV